MDINIIEIEAFLKDVTYKKYKLGDKSEPYFFGRWFKKQIDGIEHSVTLNDGSQIYFLTAGTDYFELDFTLITPDDTPYFAYSIDGKEPIRQLITEPRVMLPDNKIHTVRIITDGLYEGVGKFLEEKGFALKAISPIENIYGIIPIGTKVFFYGDSITEGIRALNMNTTADGNSATNSYTWHCSERLGILPYFVGYGASGIIKDGSFSTFKTAITNLSRDRFVDLENPKPDLVVINHGTNDAGEDKQYFRVELEKSLKVLENAYKNVPIAYLIPFNGAHNDDIEFVCKNHDNVLVIDTENWGITFTDGLHPNIEGAKTAGERLASVLKEEYKDFL